MTICTDKGQAIADLREFLHEGDEVWTILDHVSASGMTRWIKLVVPRRRDDGSMWIQDISWVAARAMGRRVNTRHHEGIEVGGCGMDMGFEVVYNLSRHLFKDDEDPVQRDAGYKLKQRWL